MKRVTFKLFSTLSLVGLSLVPATYAADSQKVKVDVPFAFNAGSKTLPAGTYSIIGSGSGALRIMGQDRMAVLSNAARANKASSQTKVVFHRYGDQCFLESVWVEGNQDGTEVVRSHRERELARGNARPDLLMLVGRLR